MIHRPLSVCCMVGVFCLSGTFSAGAQELNDAARILKNASEKGLDGFYDCIESRSVLKFGQNDDGQQTAYINAQADALFAYFALRDSLIGDPVSAGMMLKVAWKWGARDGGLCDVEWVEAVEEIRANLSERKQ